MGGRDSVEHARNDRDVLNAFRDTVASPTKSMVRVWCGEKQVAFGIIVGSDGFIATKASELNGEIACELNDGSRHAARFVGLDRASDLALLKISAGNLPTIRWSEEDPPSVGGWVITPGLNALPQAIGVVSVAPHHVARRGAGHPDG